MTNGSIIVSGGKKIVLNRAYKSTPDYNEMNQFKIGYNNGTPDVSSTDLDYPVPIYGTEVVDTCEAANWVDSADMTTALNATYFKIGTYGLDLTKDGAGSDTASCDKTTTSVDFTSKELFMWLYIIDAAMLAKLAVTDCVTIRFGSDNGNYYYYTRDKADLVVGWNVIRFTTSTADGTTGVPTIGACDYSYIAIKATGAAIVWSVNDLVMDQWQVASEGDFYTSIDGGYPTIDETNHEVELRGTIPTTHAVGFNFNGFAWFNDDATEIMGTENTFTEESKSNTDEFIFICKHRIE